MIKTIHIENFALIKNQTVEFEKRLNIVTGETGSGKSILAYAISGVFGYEISTDQILHGCESLKIQCEIELSEKKCGEIFGLTDIEAEHGTYIVSRTVLDKGKNSIRLNGSIISAATLKQIGEMIFDFHSQNETKELLKKENQSRLLDQFCEIGFIEVYEKYRELYESNISISKKISQIKKNIDTNLEKRDFLKFQIDEIEAASLKEDELSLLNKKKEILINSEKIIRSFGSVINFFGSDEAQSFDLCANIKGAAAEMEYLAKYHEELLGSVTQLNDIYWQLFEIRQDIAQRMSAFEFDPNELDSVIGRLDFISRLQKKYGSTIRDIQNRCKEFKDELLMIENSDMSIEAFEKIYAENEAKLFKLEKELFDYRKEAASRLKEKVTSDLKGLDMPDAEFEVRFIGKDLKKQNFHTNGNHDIRFAISTNKGQPLKYLDEISSGGEMARVMLVFKNLISIFDDTDILVFDEIESGISGPTAFKVGKRIFDIAKNRQVICITHIPQIAAFSDDHFMAAKKDEMGSTYSYIKKLDFGQKINEIAKLLGASRVTEKALHNSTELIQAAKEYIKESKESGRT